MSETKTTKINFVLGLFVGMAVLSTVAFLILLVVVFSGKQEVNLAANAEEIQAPAEQPEPVSATPVSPIKDGESFKGGENATVSIIEYTDFECPYCLRHHETINQVIDAYGNKIKYVLRHFPLGFHADAQKAAEAFECAAEQGKAYEMSDAIFKANGNKDMSVLALKTAAANLGMNSSNFNDCLDSDKYAGKVQQDALEGSAAGVDGTPATFVNGQLVSGALPFESFEQIIDQLLK